MPVLGIVASQMSGHLWAPSGAYDSIATVTVGSGGASTVTFSSIPSTYTHLQVRAIAQNSSTETYSLMQFNSDTAANYSNHFLDGSGTSATAGGGANDNSLYFGYITTSSNTSMFGAMVVDILDYANTNKYKTIRSLNGRDTNGAGIMELASGNWRNTNAVTSVTIFPRSNNFAQYSSFALYGIRGN